VPFHFRWTWFPVTFNAGHLLILIVVPIVTLGFDRLLPLQPTVGIAVRAQAESAEPRVPSRHSGQTTRNARVGHAAGMSGLGVLLRLPIQGVAIGSVLGPSLLLRARLRGG